MPGSGRILNFLFVRGMGNSPIKKLPGVLPAVLPGEMSGLELTDTLL